MMLGQEQGTRRSEAGGGWRTMSLHEDGIGMEELSSAQIAEISEFWEKQPHIHRGALPAAAIAGQNVPHLQQQASLSIMLCMGSHNKRKA
jgi:hypothetical protein